MSEFETKSDRKHLVVSKIKNGTVIDHISPGMSPLVLKILRIGPGSKEAVSMAMNVQSSKMGKKDILKFTDGRKVVAKCDYCGKKLYDLQDYI